MAGASEHLTGWWKRSCDAAFDLIFPPRCVGCSGDVAEGHGGLMLCQKCHDELALIDWPVCDRCAAPVPEANGVRLPCNHCPQDKLRFDRAVALGSYEGLLRGLLMRMKADRSQLVASTLAELAWRELGSILASLNVDVVTPVPMSFWRRRQRGTDPPWTMAEKLAEKLGAPAASMLRLRRNLPPQVGLSRPARFRNVAGEMTLAPTYYLQAAHVLLVDDILTTGATCSEAARVLKKAGASRVTVFVAARTPE